MDLTEDKFSKVKDWLIEEGLMRKEVPDEMADWHYVVEFPQKSNQVSDVLKPKDRRIVLLITGIVLSENHFRAFNSLTEEKKRKLIHRWKMDLIFRKADFRFLPDSFNLQKVEFSLPVFEDELSKSTVIHGLRELFKCKLYIIWNVQHEFDRHPETSYYI